MGGVKYRVGRRLVELEGGGGIVNKRSMALPGVRQKVSALNELGGGVRFAGVSAGPSCRAKQIYSDGGILPSQQAQILQQSIDYKQLGDMIISIVVNAIAAMPVALIQDVENKLVSRHPFLYFLK